MISPLVFLQGGTADLTVKRITQSQMCKVCTHNCYLQFVFQCGYLCFSVPQRKEKSRYLVGRN